MLGVFAKVLTQNVKTRLQKALSAEERRQFYLASLADTLETLASLPYTRTLFLMGAESDHDISNLRAELLSVGLPPEVWDAFAVAGQRGNDLGQRLENAFADMSRPHHSGMLIVGSDSPALGPDKLQQGLEALQASQRAPDLVLGPTRDGGYYTIGLRRVHPGLLRGIAWSTDRALEETLARARAANLRVELLPEWTDVDHPEDLDLLRTQIAQLRQMGELQRARHSERFLSGWPNRDTSS